MRSDVSKPDTAELSRESDATNRLRRFTEHLLATQSFRFLTTLSGEYPNARAFLVGGIVRDIIAGKKSKDVDILMTGMSEDNMKAFLSTHGRVELTGSAFFAYKYKPRKGEGVLHEFIDFVLPRKEQSTGIGKKDFDVQSDETISVEQDLSRRDLTINAMAFDIDEKRLVDPYGGRADYESRVLRMVGDPLERFREDYSRLFRVIRFASKLGFSIEEETKAAMPIAANELAGYMAKGKLPVKWESIRSEFLQALAHDRERTIRLLDESHLLAVIMPEVDRLQSIQGNDQGTLFQEACAALHSLQGNNASIELSLAALFHTLGSNPQHGAVTMRKKFAQQYDSRDRVSALTARTILARLRADGKLIDRVDRLLRCRTIFSRGNISEIPLSDKKLLLTDESFLRDLKRLCAATRHAHNEGNEDAMEQTFLKIKDLFQKENLRGWEDVISGDDIIHAFSLDRKTDGIRIGELQTLAVDYMFQAAASENRIPRKDEILSAIKEMKKVELDK